MMHLSPIASRSTVAAFVCAAWVGWAAAAPPEPPAIQAGEPEREARPAESTGSDFRQQPADDEIQPFEPRRPRSTEDEARVEAMALYMQAQLLQQRRDLRGAYETLERAAELDPRSASIRRALVPLAFALNQQEDAVKHATKAVELDPTDHETLRRLGLQLATEGKLEQATELLQKAADSPKLAKRSPVYVALMRELGVLHAAIGNVDKAGDAFAILLDALQNPGRYGLDAETLDTLQADQPATYERIGQALLEAERYDGAKTAYERAGALGRWTPATLGFHLAEVLAAQGKHDEALAELRKYFDAQLQSKGREPYALLAQILVDQKKKDEVIPRVEELFERDRFNTNLQLFLADQYLEADRLGDAEKKYRDALKGSGAAEGHLGLAAIHRRRGQPVELLRSLAQALQAKRDGDRADERLAEEIRTVVEDEKLLASLIEAGRERAQGDEPELEVAEALLLAKLAVDADRTDDAVAFYRFAIPRVDARRKIAIQGELGETLQGAEKYAEAAEVYRAAAEEPLVVDNKQLRAELLMRFSQSAEMAGDTDGALEAIREARKLVPENPLLHFQEAWVNYHARRWDDAIAVFEAVVRDYPEPEYTELTKRALFSISNIHVEKGEFDKGEAILEKFLEENPDDPGVNNDLGYLWADRDKNLDRAEKMIRKALEAEPENAAYLDSMGWVLYRKGKHAEAVEYLEKALSDPVGGDATIWDHLGDAYEKLGNIDKARDAWQKALDEAKKGARPDEKLVEKIQKKLRQRGRVEPPGA